MKYAPEICMFVGVFVGVGTCRISDRLFPEKKPTLSSNTYVTNLLAETPANVTIPLGAITTTNVPPKVEVDPYDTTKFRVLTDGTRWKVQNNRGYRNTWQDDVWGGYFATEKEARDRVEDQRKLWRDIAADAATAKNFKEVVR